MGGEPSAPLLMSSRKYGLRRRRPRRSPWCSMPRGQSCERKTVGEESCTRGQRRRNDGNEGGEAHEGEADDIVLADVVDAAHRAMVIRDALVVA